VKRSEHKKAAKEHQAKAGKRGTDAKYHLKASEIHSRLAENENKQAEEHLAKAGKRGGPVDYHLEAADALTRRSE
jgi:hypothetical protein